LASADAGLGVIQTFSFLAQPAVDRGELVPVLTRFQLRSLARCPSVRPRLISSLSSSATVGRCSPRWGRTG